VKEHALFMKETRDAERFKEQVLARMEQASLMQSVDEDAIVTPEQEKKLKQLLTFVIVGGGPTGVELAGELTDFLSSEGVNQYKHLKEWITVHIFTYDLLNMFDKTLQNYAASHLKKKQGVQLHLGAIVKSVDKDTMTIKDGEGKVIEIDYGTLVWCAGIKPHKFVSDYGFPMNERGTQILTDKNLKVKGEDSIWALGDCATIDDYWLPQTAQVAKQQAIYLAKDLNSAHQVGYPSKPFKFHSLGMMAYLGGHNALMSHLPGIDKLTGFLAFLSWRSCYWGLQLSMRNRYMLATDWIRTILFGRDLTRFGPASKPT